MPDKILPPVALKTCAKGLHQYSGMKCLECHRAYKIEWCAKNKERLTAKKAADYLANIEKFKARAAARHIENRDEILRKNNEKYARSPDSQKARSKQYRAENPDRARKACSDWSKANPDVRLIHHQNRRAMKKASGGKLSQGLAKRLFSLQKGKCPCCKQPLGDNFHLDHIIPLALGGPNIDSNMQLLRAKCNMQKNAKHPVDFMQSRGFLL